MRRLLRAGFLLLWPAATSASAFALGGAGAPVATPAPAFSVARSGAGRPMILIPGVASSGAVWDSTVARFRDRSDCHVLALAGFAGQPAVQPLSLARVRDELIAYIRAHRLERPVLVGHSLGGFLALWVAASAPEIVGPVVAVDGVPFLPALLDPTATVEGGRARATQLRALYSTLTPAQLGAQSRLALSGMIRDAPNVDLAAGWSAASDPSSVGQAMYELMTTDLRLELASIRTPVLLVGAADFAKDAAQRQAVLAAYEAQVERVTRHRVLLAEHARHFIMMDDPAFLFATLEGFLGAADGAGK